MLKNKWITINSHVVGVRYYLRCRYGHCAAILEFFSLFLSILVYENRALKMKFLWCQRIFFMNFGFKNGCKNEFKDNNEKSCSSSRNRVLTKSVSKPNGPATAMPTALELKIQKFVFPWIISISLKHFCHYLKIWKTWKIIIISESPGA